jgi:predicted glycosyltransferase
MQPAHTTVGNGQKDHLSRSNGASSDGSTVGAIDPGGEPEPTESEAAEKRTVIVTIQHPADVHFFKHAIKELNAGGHEVYVFAREKEVAIDLLDAYGIAHEVLAGAVRAGSLISLGSVQLAYEGRLLRRAYRLQPDVIAAVGGVAAAHVAALVGARSVVFYDTEHATLQNALAYPLADTVCTPACYREDLGSKQVRYPGYHELAYLHPDRFTPAEGANLPTELGLDGAGTNGEGLVVLRVVDWGAAHDVGQSGFADISHAVSRLERTGATVVISAEGDLPATLEGKCVSVPPHRMHDLLSHADLYIGEGATMAAESAVLGTPAVYVNTLTMGYTDELDETYGLLFNCCGRNRHERALGRAESVLAGGDTSASDWWARREHLLTETVDTTNVIIRELLRTSPLSTTTTRPRERRRSALRTASEYADTVSATVARTGLVARR